MYDDPDGREAPTRAVYSATAAVVLWRVVALALIFRTGADGAPLVQSSLTVAGLVFLVCGIVVLHRVPGEPGRLFAWFCICGGLHWGGPLELPDGSLRTALLFFYLLISGILGAVLLLHFALVFPVRSSIAGRRRAVVLLYAPVVFAALLAVARLALPPASELRSAAQVGFLAIHTVATNLFGAAVLVTFTIHALRPGTDPARRKYLGRMVAGMLVAWLPYLVASSLDSPFTDFWNLTVVALPLSFAGALIALRRARPADENA